MNILGLDVQDIDPDTMVTDVTLLIQGLTPDGERALFLRSTVTDKVHRLGAVTIIHTRCIAEVNESFEEDA
ncbi:MAG TPA: hypothetical protein VLS51_00200 [Propionibacteriaceae bacterium]|nr:hypothetical protein [Propionibacteriaceae bacterium]